MTALFLLAACMLHPFAGGGLYPGYCLGLPLDKCPIMTAAPTTSNAHHALGPWISAVFAPSGANPRTIRYYYDGARVLEERNGSDVRQRYRIHGGQYVDEHVATFNDAAGSFRYYLHNDLYTVVAVGDAGGMVGESYTYGAYGVSTVNGGGCKPSDLDGDNDVDIGDIPQFIAVLLTGTGSAQEHCAADVNCDGMVDGRDIQPFDDCLLGASCPPARSGSGLRSPFTLHGAPVDVLSDGLMLQYNRARYYDIRNGRWLQRDPAGYRDGGNLYEAFRCNPSVNTDPDGRGVLTWLFVGDYDQSDWKFVKSGGLQQAGYGFLQGGAKASANVVIGAGKTVREVAYVLADGTVIFLDIPATLAGHPIQYTPLSQVGQASANTTEPLTLTGQVAGNATANIVTLGAYNTVRGTIDYYRTGDEQALAQNVGGPGLLTLAAVGAVRSAMPTTPGAAAVARRAPGLSAGEIQGLLARFAAISETGEINILNIARRGVAITADEATAGLRGAEVDIAPRVTQYFSERILGDFIRYGRYSGRLGNIGTRITTLDQLTMLEEGRLTPRLEFRIPIVGPSGPRNIFPNIAASTEASRVPIRFIEVVKRHDPGYETLRRSLIQQTYPDATVIYVLSR